MTEYLKFQATMTKAYEGYTEKMDLKDFYASLNPWTRSVVAFGNLNYQVENGGFSQWHDNGYYVGLDAILHGLIRLDTPEAGEMLNLIQSARDRLHYLDKLDEDEDDNWAGSKLDTLDSAFYALAPKVLQQIEDSLP